MSLSSNRAACRPGPRRPGRGRRGPASPPHAQRRPGPRGRAPGVLAKGQCAGRCAVGVCGLTAAPADAVHDERDRCGHCY